MATATFINNRGQNATRTLTADSQGNTTNSATIVGPTATDQQGRTCRPIYIRQTATSYRLIGFEREPAGASVKTTYDCKDR